MKDNELISEITVDLSTQVPTNFSLLCAVHWRFRTSSTATFPEGTDTLATNWSFCARSWQSVHSCMRGQHEISDLVRHRHIRIARDGHSCTGHAICGVRDTTTPLIIAEGFVTGSALGQNHATAVGLASKGNSWFPDFRLRRPPPLLLADSRVTIQRVYAARYGLLRYVWSHTRFWAHDFDWTDFLPDLGTHRPWEPCPATRE